jgi:hypothetical protein
LAIEKHFWTGGPEAYRQHAGTAKRIHHSS